MAAITYTVVSCPAPEFRKGAEFPSTELFMPRGNHIQVMEWVPAGTVFSQGSDYFKVSRYGRLFRITPQPGTVGHAPNAKRTIVITQTTERLTRPGYGMRAVKVG